MSKVLVTRSKLDNLATIISAKSGAELPLTLDQMEEAARGIDVGGHEFVITLSYDAEQDLWVPDCTYEDVLAADAAGKTVALRCDDENAIGDGHLFSDFNVYAYRVLSEPYLYTMDLTSRGPSMYDDKIYMISPYGSFQIDDDGTYDVTEYSEAVVAIPMRELTATPTTAEQVFLPGTPTETPGEIKTGTTLM